MFMAQKDPQYQSLVTQLASIERTMKVMINRIHALERDNKILRGRIGRATDHIGAVERQSLKSR